ncbi:stress protein [Lewinellaceae bacterium SD302]|nr:stress protein [Lewinellaceae bacterium SD302]
MKNTLVLLILSLIAFSCEGEFNTEYTDKYEQPVAELMEVDEPDSLLRHVVLFAFKDESSKADIRSVEEAFNALPGKIPEIHGYEWGINNSPEDHDKGFTHAYFLTFKSEADRGVYLPHPDHKAFGKILGPHLKDVLVVDYWTRN